MRTILERRCEIGFEIRDTVDNFAGNCEISKKIDSVSIEIVPGRAGGLSLS